MSDEVEITDGDREAAASVTVLAEMRELILSGRADHHAEPWAIHRITADLAGYELGQRETVERIVAWLRKENSLCDCYARSEGECGCGAWDDYKQWPLERTADAIEAGEWK